jgi:hypothetical protein
MEHAIYQAEGRPQVMGQYSTSRTLLLKDNRLRNWPIARSYPNIALVTIRHV